MQHSLGKRHVKLLRNVWRVVGDQRGLYVALAELAGELTFAGDFVAARDAATETLALEDPAWPQRLRCVGARMGIGIAVETGDVQAARNGMLEALELVEAAGDARDAPRARISLADLATVIGHFDEAIALGRTIIAEVQQVHQPTTHGLVLTACAPRT